MISKFRLSCDRLSKKTTLLHDASHEIDRLLSVSSLNCDCLSVCNDARCLTCDLTSESTAEAKGSLKRKATVLAAFLSHVARSNALLDSLTKRRLLRRLPKLQMLGPTCLTWPKHSVS